MEEVTVEIAYRVLTSEDVPKIVAIEEEFLNDPAMCMKSDLADIEKSCSSECSQALTINGEIVSYALCYPNEYGIGFVDKCFVKPGHRGNGDQRTHTVFGIVGLLKFGVRKVFTMVSPDNEVSLRNFEEMSFRKSHEVICNGHKRIVLCYEVGN